MYQTTHHPSFLAAKSLCKLWVMTTKNDTCDLNIGMFLTTMVFGPIIASEVGGWEDGEIEGVGIIWNILPRSRRWRQWTGAKGSKAIHFQTDVRWHGINHGRGGRWARRADQKDPGVREVLQRHRGEAPVQRSGKRGRSPLPQEPPYPPPKKLRRSGKAFSKRSKARYAKLDDKRELSKVEVQELRYSQLSCKETFQCGRSVSQLVQDLLDRKVSLFAPFLRLTVFETTDEETNDPILRCIDNQRLFALKEYAKKSGKDRLMVNVNLFSQNTLTQVQRFIQNSYDTDGRDVRF